MADGFGHKPQKKRRIPRAPIHMDRVSAEVQIGSTKEIAPSRVFLHDLNPTGVGIFINKQLPKGEQVSLVIEQPRHLFVRGEVIWCSPYTLDTRILSDQNFSYRVGIKFLFETNEEKDAIRKYCDEISIPVPKAPLVKKAG